MKLTTVVFDNVANRFIHQLETCAQIKKWENISN